MSTYDESTKLDAPFYFAGVQSDVAAFASGQGIESEFRLVVECTRQIFGDDIQVVVEEDPEIAGDIHIIFEVKAYGTVDEVLRKESEWHRQCYDLVGSAAFFFRLLVDIQ